MSFTELLSIVMFYLNCIIMTEIHKHDIK